MGRLPKPDVIKKAQGTLQKCRANRQQLQVNGNLPVQPPTELTKDARAAWELAITCAPESLLTALDHSLLERWCRNYALYRKLQADVDRHGWIDIKGKPRPSFTALIKIQAALAQCEQQLGFTLVSRCKMQAPAKEDSKSNEFDDL